jgi:UDP-GlcNAc:undecaprenyl-phosphate/decaprenyl-phosphate GlcNAc-1-phosphate transferase
MVPRWLSDYKYLIVFGLAFMITYLFIPFIIRLALQRGLVDKPGERKIHKGLIPNLGGVAIFIGFAGASLLWVRFFNNLDFIWILTAVILLFLTGVVDDVKGLKATTKLSIQVAVSFILVAGGIRLTSFYGLFGIHELPLAVQYFYSMIVIVGVINAYNFIDGMDGLAGGLGFISFLVMAVIFISFGNVPYAILSFSMAGALLAFLRFNFNPASIFMGDTGALLIGLMIVVLGIKAIEMNGTRVHNEEFIPNMILLVASVMGLPVFDTLRVSLIRISHKKSPFTPDNRHLHHILLRYGFDQRKTVLILYAINILIILTGFLIKDMKPLQFSGELLFFNP